MGVRSILKIFGMVVAIQGVCLTAALAQSGPMKADEGPAAELISWWSFDRETDDAVTDEIQQSRDALHGNHEYVDGVSGRAIKLDGFRTYIRRDRSRLDRLTGAFTVESWIALAGFPWSWAPVIDCAHGNIKGFFFGIGPEGRVGFKAGVGSAWTEAVTEARIPLREWVHIAAVFEPDRRIAVFVNGKEAVAVNIRGELIPSGNSPLTIGRTSEPQTWHEFQLTTENAFFFLDGILDEIKITGRAKTAREIGAEYGAAGDLPVPALSVRDRLPVGPAGSGGFGAFYTRLDYYKEWDELWRVSDVPDVFVRFDRSPVQLVFWRGASFVPCWVTEDGIWYTNEWLETWGSDVASCAEPIMDRQCRYSHVRIIENTEARVVIHWRYALSDAFYDFAAVSDDGRGEWCDEFHIVYPDQVGIRKMELHYSKPERSHDWVEQIVVLPPGKTPDDVIETEAVSLVNMSGAVRAYSWHDEDLGVEMREPERANMSYVHLRSAYRPFFVLSPDPFQAVEGTWDSPFFRTYAAKMGKGYRPDPVPSVYGWWDHWPVAQIPGDGRWVTTPDRPSHFNLTTFVQWKDHEKTGRTRTRIMLQGMTDKKPGDLVPLARSWLHAPEMIQLSDGFTGGSYDRSERAYIIDRVGPEGPLPCMYVLQASEGSPLLNPAVIIRNWGDRSSRLTVDGRELVASKDYRRGIIRRPEASDLVIWINMESREPVRMTVEATGSK